MKLALTATPAAPRPAPLLLYGDLAGAFRQTAESGCQGLELHMACAADVDAHIVRRLETEYGVSVPTLGTGMAAADGLSFSDPDPAVRALTVERVQGHIRLAAEVGSAVTIGTLSGKLGCRSWVTEGLTRVCRFAEPLGVTVLLEPLNRYECDHVRTLAEGIEIVAEVGAPNLMLLADTFHMNIEEADLAASFQMVGPLLGHVHLADSNRQAPGHGHLNIPGVLDALNGIGYQGYLSFEVFPLPDAETAIHDGIQTVARIQKGAYAWA